MVEGLLFGIQLIWSQVMIAPKNDIYTSCIYAPSYNFIQPNSAIQWDEHPHLFSTLQLFSKSS